MLVIARWTCPTETIDLDVHRDRSRLDSFGDHIDIVDQRLCEGMYYRSSLMLHV